MLWWSVVLLAVFLIGVTKSGFGAGVGLMIVPMTTIAMGHTSRGSEAALGLMLPLLVAGDVLAVWQYRRLIHRASPAVTVLRKLAPGMIVGVLIGALLLKLMHQRADLVGALIRIEIGLESIGLVALYWWQQARGKKGRTMPEPWRSHTIGFFSAVSSSLAHAAGPIIAMYLLPLELDRQLFVGTCALYFGILNTAKLPAYQASQMFAKIPLSFSLQFLPVVFAGALFGFWLNKRLNDRLFSKIIYAVTFVLGWYVLAEGVFMLMGR